MLAAEMAVDFEGQHSAVAVAKPPGHRRNINATLDAARGIESSRRAGRFSVRGRGFAERDGVHGFEALVLPDEILAFPSGKMAGDVSSLNAF